jgi:putative transposase
MAMELLPEMVGARNAVLFSWCIMPDHLHFLLQDKDVIDFVRIFKGRLTPEARRLERGRALWQRSFYDHALREAESLGDVARYI